MSLSSIKRIEDLININDVVFWYDVNDIGSALLSSGIPPSTLYSRYVSNNATLNGGTTGFSFTLDDRGYKCLRESATTNRRYSTTVGSVDNNNETFIMLGKLYTAFTAASPIIGGSPGAGGFGDFSYANYTVGNGRIQSINGGFIDTLKITTGVMTPTKMSLYINCILNNVLNNPTLSTDTNSKTKYIFWNQVNPSAYQRDWYTAIRIKNTYSEETLKNIIRIVAFEHGVKI